MRILLLPVLILLAPAAALAEGEAGFLPEGAALSGGTLRVGIRQSGAPGLAAFDCALSFDPAVLVIEGVEPGPAAPGAMVESREAGGGRLLLSLVVPEGVSGDGIVCHLRFRVTGPAGAVSPLVLTDLSAYDGQTLAAIPLRPIAGEIRVDAPGTPLPPPIPAPPPTRVVVPLGPGGTAPPVTPAPAGGPSPDYPPVPPPAGHGLPAVPPTPGPPVADDGSGQRFILILLAFIGVAILVGVFRRRGK
jgi:hypothetical protein